MSCHQVKSSQVVYFRNPSERTYKCIQQKETATKTKKQNRTHFQNKKQRETREKKIINQNKRRRKKEEKEKEKRKIDGYSKRLKRLQCVLVCRGHWLDVLHGVRSVRGVVIASWWKSNSCWFSSVQFKIAHARLGKVHMRHTTSVENARIKFWHGPVQLSLVRFKNCICAFGKWKFIYRE